MGAERRSKRLEAELGGVCQAAFRRPRASLGLHRSLYDRVAISNHRLLDIADRKPSTPIQTGVAVYNGEPLPHAARWAITVYEGLSRPPDLFSSRARMAPRRSSFMTGMVR
jgi:hypothetical protein